MAFLRVRFVITRILFLNLDSLSSPVSCLGVLVVSVLFANCDYLSLPMSHLTVEMICHFVIPYVSF